MNEIPLKISFSGGRTSAFMTKYLLTRYPCKKIIVLFANTGKEEEPTLEFINECDKRWGFNTIWLEAVIHPEKGVGTTHKVISFETANREGKPFEDMIKKYGLPNLPHPHCTRELKLAPMKSYMRELGIRNYQDAVGIRYDELHRINRNNVGKKIYPLADDMRATKKMILDWWAKQEFDLQLKDYEGNCDMCWKKSERKLMTLHKENPNKIKWWSEMEKKYGKGRFVFFRNNKSAQDIIAQSEKPFRMAIDEKEILDNQQTMFDGELDLEFGCTCKST